jgi:hypothetical protein
VRTLPAGDEKRRVSTGVRTPNVPSGPRPTILASPGGRCGWPITKSTSLTVGLISARLGIRSTSRGAQRRRPSFSETGPPAMIPLRNERRRDGSNVESRINRWNIIGTSWRIVARSASDRRPDARPSASSSCLTCTTAPGRTHRQSTTVPDTDALPAQHEVFEPKTRSLHHGSALLQGAKFRPPKPVFDLVVPRSSPSGSTAERVNLTGTSEYENGSSRFYSPMALMTTRFGRCPSHSP